VFSTRPGPAGRQDGELDLKGGTGSSKGQRVGCPVTVECKTVHGGGVREGIGRASWTIR